MACLLFIVLCSSSWGRYQITKVELVVLGAPVLSGGGSWESTLATRIREPGLRSRLYQDPSVLKTLIESQTNFFEQNPRHAWSVLQAHAERTGSLKNAIEQSPPTFLLAALAGSARERNEPGADFEVPDDLVKTILKPHQAQIEQAPRSTLELLTVCLLDFPEMFGPEEREKLLENWKDGFVELREPADRGARDRARLKKFLDGRPEISVRLQVDNLLSSKVLNDPIPALVSQLTLALIQSCGVVTSQSLAQEDGLVCEIVLVERVIGETSRRNDTTQTKYSTRVSYSGFGKRRTTSLTPVATTVKTEGQTTTSYSTTPVVIIKFHLGDETLELEERVLYWEHLGDGQTSEERAGPLWPFGLRDKFYR